MLVVLSPAKTLDFNSENKLTVYTMPSLLEHSAKLIEQCRKLAPMDIANLMKVSDKIANLNAARFAEWSTEHNEINSCAAILAFKGDVYTGLEAEHFSENELAWAQEHLRMLSGLYGVLRPLDLMQPYRLEMGCKLANTGGKDLYQFWGSKISEELNKALNKQKDNILINLASHEYFKSIDKKMLSAQIFTPVFKDLKNGQYKIISFYAKKARGLMAKYIIKNKINNINELVHFDYAGYAFCEAESDNEQWIFKREKA